MAGTGFLKSGPCRCIETYIERIRLTKEFTYVWNRWIYRT